MRRRRPTALAVMVVCLLAGCQAAPSTPAGLATKGSFLPGAVSGASGSAPESSTSIEVSPTDPSTTQPGGDDLPPASSTQPVPSTPSSPTSNSVGAGESEMSSGSPTLGTSLPWTEEFDGRAGAAPNTNLFTSRTGGNGWGNQEIQTYTTKSANAALDGSGHLEIQARRETVVGADNIKRSWTSARMDSFGKWEFTTGTIEIRMKIQPGTGLWPAFWLEGSSVPTAGWPDCGEIDVAEIFGAKNAVSQTVHGPDGTDRGYQYSSDTAAPAGSSVGDGYHTFSVTRSPGKILFGIDGNVSGTLTPSILKKGQKWVYDAPMFVVLNFAVGGFAGTPTAATPSPASLLVDWIKFIPLTS